MDKSKINSSSNGRGSSQNSNPERRQGRPPAAGWMQKAQTAPMKAADQASARDSAQSPHRPTS